ncbi:MAG: thioredoxin-disulfide reductase, partial [Methanosarcina sp.]|nr:thioredoxin-disulfide reductase [Methanosarcina sp.]
MYDLIIIGGGPAGIAAGIYAVRFGLDTIILERNEISGQISMADVVENYPGFPSISGLELMEKYRTHAREAGVKTMITEALSVRSEGTKKIVSTDSGDLEAKAVIIATGANPKHLGVPGEKEFISKGVSYCAICDGPFFKNKTVVVVGGGNSAVTDALFLSKVAQKVYLVHRRDHLRAAKILQDRVAATSNIELVLNTLVMEIAGSREGVKKVEKVILQDINGKEIRELPANGVFIYVGINPNTEFVNVEKDDEGFIRTNRWMETSEKGIYAAGDCRDTPIWQLVAAVRDGAIAATAAYEYIE